MWKIFLTGSSKDQEEWQHRIKNAFEGKYAFLKSGNSADVAGTESTVLDHFLPSASKGAVLTNLSIIGDADLVLSNSSFWSAEVSFQNFYANLIRKPILIFAEKQQLEQESDKNSPFIQLFTDNFFQSFDEISAFLSTMQMLPIVQESETRNLALQALQKEVANLFAKEDRKDALFRGAILATQIGQSLHYLTHDRQINPGARTVGSRADEEAQLGDCLIQLAIYCLSRNFNISDVYSIGARRMGENVWRNKKLEIIPRELRPNEIGYGISASFGDATGRVVIVRNPEDASKISDGKCIVAVAEYTKPIWDEIAARIENVLGLISGTGSPNMHPAIVCRELKKPCIVSAKELVNQLNDNEIVTMAVGKGLDDNSVTRVNR